MPGGLTFADLRAQFLFGLVDGINGAVGLVIGLLGSHAAAPIVLVALMSRAFSSTVSMAGAQYESDDLTTTRVLRAARPAAMGAGYLSSALLPGLGFAVSVRVGVAVFAPASLLVLLAIAWVRHRRSGWPRALTTTLVVFALAVAAGLAATAVS